MIIVIHVHPTHLRNFVEGTSPKLEDYSNTGEKGLVEVHIDTSLYIIEVVNESYIVVRKHRP